MTPETRLNAALARSADYFNIMRTTFFTNAAIIAIIQLGPDGYSAPLTMMAIAVAAYGILAGGAALDDLIGLRDDMDDDLAATNYGRRLKARNLPALKMLSSVLMGLVGVAELYAIFT